MTKLATKPKPRKPVSTWRAEPFVALREEFDDLLSRFWGDEEEGWFTGRIAPSVDLAETDTAIEARMDLPGMTADEIDIQLSQNNLTVSGERKEEKEDKHRTWHRIERRSGSFSRSFTLPCGVQEDEVVAEFRDGVLTITMPKDEEHKARRVKVKG